MTKNKTEVQYISTGYAATLSGVTIKTIRNWITTYNIGKKVGGRWKVDYTKSQILLKGYSGKMESPDEKEWKESRRRTSDNNSNRAD